MAQDTLLGFPAHTLYPQGVCGIRKAAEPLTAALPYRCGEFTTLLTGPLLSRRHLYAIGLDGDRAHCTSLRRVT